MTEEQIRRNLGLCEALRANKKKAIDQMRDHKGGRCCLCVAMDYANAHGENFEAENNLRPPSQMADWYGWTTSNPTVAGHYLSRHNDGLYTEYLTHAEIADLIEEHLIPKTPKPE